MNGAHDLGGMHGFGPVEREVDEPVFHEPWEARVYGMSRSVLVQAVHNIDEFRSGIERMPPDQYLASSYYERWLATLERNLVEKGVLTLEEIDARADLYYQQPAAEVPRRDDPELAERVLARLRSRPTAFERQPSGPALYAVGDRVVTRNTHPIGHTRLPRYARGRSGVVARVHGVYVLPDTSAQGQGEHPEWLYSVCFGAGELWGGSAEARQSVFLDLWESYLQHE